MERAEAVVADAAAAVNRTCPSGLVSNRGPFMVPRFANGRSGRVHKGRMQSRWVRWGVPKEFAPGVKPRGFHRRMSQREWPSYSQSS